MTSERERFAVMHQFGRTYRAFMAAFESYVGQPMPRWRIMLALHDHTGGGLAQKQLAERLQMDPGRSRASSRCSNSWAGSSAPPTPATTG